MACLIHRIKSHAAHVANLTYGPSGDGHRFTVVPTTPPLMRTDAIRLLVALQLPSQRFTHITF